MTKLTQTRRCKFVAEYLKDRNGTRAAIAAGYSSKTAAQIASRLLRNVNVREEIQETTTAEAMSGDQAVRTLGHIGNGDLRKFFNADGMTLKPVTALDDETAACVAYFEVEERFEGQGANRHLVGYLKRVKLWDKVQALQLVGKAHGKFNEKIDVSVRNLNVSSWTLDEVEEVFAKIVNGETCDTSKTDEMLFEWAEGLVEKNKELKTEQEDREKCN